MSNRTRVLVADDHRVFLEGLKLIIGNTEDLTVADEASDGQEVVYMITNKDYGLLVLDISMPGRNGLDILKDIKRIRPKLPVLIMSMHSEDQYAMRALRAGASGYLTKGSSLQELLAAMRKVAAGKKYLTSFQAEMLASRLDGDPDAPLHERLSEREHQVMLRIASGATPKIIAEDLMVGVRTVNTYRSRLLQKMEMKCNAELTAYILQHKLI